ncbi:MIR domain protein [Ichthyophthirius multifiliis]|uniref:MIR domain protein n=1 Tax=Ichthyophthirius multifiliis TaxID=5932 RepID=G0QVT5_ICHMU|nr:MIR domain protein [Ichthyophthirius multifiliis]EGR30673.1 MIR domain protein [Ichthyophthirius multifiliis]|eukprot:XP_004032260.1 MIR domain protein [Ichthyophthirius multifiliis]
MFKGIKNTVKYISKGTPKRSVNKNFDEIEIENTWKLFLEQLNYNSDVQNEIDNEKSALTSAILDCKQLIKDEFYKDIEPKPDKQAILKKFIIFLQYAIEDITNKNTIKVLLQVLRNMVEENKENEEEQIKMQNQLDSLGATRMVLYVISENHKNLDSEMLIQFLNFVNTLLEGGNVKVQKTLFEFYTTHQKSEVIFKRFNHIIRKQITIIEQKAKEKSKARSNTMNLIQDELDSSNDQTDIELLEFVLNFLQLSCEGHNLKLQNYVRQQTNSRNNYDMINAIADLLKTYYYDARTQQMYENMIKCLDTLNEFVQGPCLENQIAVSESKFFEIANDIFTIKRNIQENPISQQITMKSKESLKQSITQKKNQKIKSNEGLENWMIYRMQNKCLILILSLLEMRYINENNIIIKKIMRNLPLSLLEPQLVEIYKLYQAAYGENYQEECLEYLSKDPKSIVDDKGQKKLECVTQNGFYIIFLIQYYLEYDDKLDSQIVSLQKMHKNKVLKTEQNALEGLLFGDNILGQIASFAMNFLKEGLYAAQQMKSYANNIMAKGEEDETIKQQKEEEENKKMLKKAFFFFSDHTAHIDVVRNNQLEIVFFILLPFTDCLPKDKKIEFHENVDRQSVKTKVGYLMQQCKSFIEISKHEHKLKIIFSQNKFIALFANYVNLWKQLTFTLTLILNIFILISFNSDYEDRINNYRLYDALSDQRLSQDRTDQIFDILGIIMTICSSFVVLFFLCKNVPLIVKKAWSDDINQGQKNKNMRDQGAFKILIIFLTKLFKVIFIFLQEIEVMYYIAYGALAVLGTVIHPFFYTFHLTEILIRYPTLKNVIKSVYIPRTQLYLTFVLFIIIVYTFTLIGFTFFYKDYDGNCDNLLICFLFTFDFTFKANGGIGGQLTEMWVQKEKDNEQEYNPNFQAGRLLFDNFYNIILVIIMVQIVAGIIVEAFEELRENEQTKNRDISDKCFICDNLKTDFNRKQDTKGGFVEHIKLNHYMWNYIKFIAYIQWKQPTEYTGIESYIFEKWQNNDLSWFPLNKARELDDKRYEEDEEELKQINQMNQDIIDAMEGLKETHKIITKLHKKK